MCNSILTLFYGEKLKDVLRLAECCLFWAKKDNPLPLATLFSNFSESKRLHSKERKQKIFAAQTPPQKRGYEEDFARSKTFFSHTAFTKVTALLLRYVHVTFGEIAARQARGWGGFLSNDLVDIMLLSAVSRFCKCGSVRFSAELYSYPAKHKTNYL